MKTLTFAVVAAMTLAGFSLTGCSHETSRHETDHMNSDGTMRKDSTSTYKNSDGSTTTVREKDVRNPNY